jgi:hypothetical protein
MIWSALRVSCDNQAERDGIIAMVAGPRWSHVWMSEPLSYYEDDPRRPWYIDFISFQPFNLVPGNDGTQSMYTHRGACLCCVRADEVLKAAGLPPQEYDRRGQGH